MQNPQTNACITWGWTCRNDNSGWGYNCSASYYACSIGCCPIGTSDPGGGGTDGVCSPACGAGYYCCGGNCSENLCSPTPPGPKPTKCKGINVGGVTPNSDGTYILNQYQEYTLGVAYYWPPSWDPNAYFYGALVYNPLVCEPVNKSTRNNRDASNRVVIGESDSSTLVQGWNYLTYNWTPTITGNNINVT